MKKITLLWICALIGVMPVFAQDWVEGADEVLEFNCDVITDIISEFNDEEFVKTDKGTASITDYFAEIVPDCVSVEDTDTVKTESDFSVIVNGNINLRSCAGTNCDVVGQAADGSVLEVLGEEDDWYEVIFNGEAAFIASWLTTRGPDAIIETEARYTIEDNNCSLYPAAKRGDMDVNVILTGDRQDDIIVDIYRPNDQYALRVDSQYLKTFIDSDDLYILQVYRWNMSFPTGLYTIEVTLDDETHRIGWNVTERAEYNIYVRCS